VFCSIRCQNAFHQIYKRWVNGLNLPSHEREVAMIDASEVEREAMRRCLRDLGSAAERVGFSKPIAAYSESEALTVIDAIVTGYTTAMTEHHEATRNAPLYGRSLTPDPMRSTLESSDETSIPF
jgi:hypothetical protein